MKRKRIRPAKFTANADGLNPKALEAARKKVEDVLISFRNSRISVMGGNGFVCREKDGTPSDVLRLSTWEGLALGIKVYLAKVATPPRKGKSNGK